jgi:Tol biopolymer transport system component
MRKLKNTCLLTALCILSALAVGCPVPDGGGGFPMERVSVNNSGVQGNADSVSYGFSMSGDGRYVAFVSDATNLVSNDTNGFTDVFVYDRQTDTIERVSVSGTGAESNDVSDRPSISADGRYVAFQSDATNLIPSDTNASGDIFVRDRTLNTTERVSVATGGAEGNSISSGTCSISADGQFVAFLSSSTNLVSGDTNGARDIFVRDRTLNTTERVSVATSGAEGDYESSTPSISADGRYVAFDSSARNLGSGDTNNYRDIFVRDRTLNTTERVSVATGGAQSHAGSSYYPRISSDGRFVAFESTADNLGGGDTNMANDIFVRDRTALTTERVSVDSNGMQGDGDSAYASLSADGRFVAFTSAATTLVTGDTNGANDVFVYDRQSHTMTRVSVNASGGQGNGYSDTPSLSADGYCVAFPSGASNLVSGDTNGYWDVFAFKFR